MGIVKVGIVGAGTISHYHTRAYQNIDDVEVTAVCDINENRAQDYAKQYQIPDVFTDYNQLLSKGDIDAISVVTWNNMHAPISIAALKAGKDVLCEKPLAVNAVEAEKMVATANETDNLLMVGFVRRFGENAENLKCMIDQGELGKIYYAKTGIIRRWGNPGGWFSDKERSGGGPLIDNGVHFIDMARYLTGKPEVKSVMASTFNRLGMKPEIKGINKYYSSDYSEYNDVEDGAAAFIKFANDLTLFVETFWVAHTGEDKIYLNLFGDKAGAQLEPFLEYYGEKNNYLTKTQPTLDSETSGMEYIFNGEISHFIDCVKNDDTVCISPAEDGLALMKIIDAIYESAETGHEVKIN